LNKAKALSAVKAHSRAAKLYEALGEFELAGDCYVLAKEMEDALKSYKKAGATQKRRPLLKKLKRLGEIIPELLESKDYIQVAKIYKDIGEYLKAGYYFDRAKKHALALNAFKQIQPNETLNEKDHRFIAHLAEALNDPEFAIEHYQAIKAFNEAAEITYSLGDDERTLKFCQLAGNDLRRAETLERLQRFDEAAILFTKLRKPLRAAENWIKQVDKKIDAETGIRYLKHDPEIITWLTKAKNLFEEEMTFNSAQAEYCTMHIGKCQITLAKIRREPALRLEMTADPLKYMQGNQVFVTVNNTGWGSTESLALSIKSDHIKDMSATYIGVLQPKQQWRQTIAGIVPKISGTINLSMELINQTTGKSVYHSAPEMARVVQPNDPISRFANNNQPIQLKIEKYVVGGMEINDSVINRSNIGSTGDSTPSNEFDSAIVSRAELNRQLSARKALEISKILCPQCGESIADDAKFCRHCGCVINGSKKEGDK